MDALPDALSKACTALKNQGCCITVRQWVCELAKK